jgi:hypothetical protein
VEHRFLQAVLRRFQALIESVEYGDSLDGGWRSPKREESLALC